MNEQPTPYEPKRRSRVTVVKGASEVAMTLTQLVKGMVTGTLGNVPLTSDVYPQIPYTDALLDTLLAKVMFDNELEVLGLIDGRVYRDDLLAYVVGDEPDSPDLDSLPHLILTEGITR